MKGPGAQLEGVGGVAIPALFVVDFICALLLTGFRPHFPKPRRYTVLDRYQNNPAVPLYIPPSQFCPFKCLVAPLKRACNVVGLHWKQSRKTARNVANVFNLKKLWVPTNLSGSHSKIIGHSISLSLWHPTTFLFLYFFILEDRICIKFGSFLHELFPGIIHRMNTE